MKNLVDEQARQARLMSAKSFQTCFLLQALVKCVDMVLSNSHLVPF